MKAPPHGRRHLSPPPAPSPRRYDAVPRCPSGPPGWHGRRHPVCAPLPPLGGQRFARPLRLLPASIACVQCLLTTRGCRPAPLVAANAAGYATLREIEGRLKSIRNIEKITKTMKVVASTKLTRATRAMAESRKYGQTSNTVFESAETKPIEGEGKKALIIVCSSDKGLCGGVHSGLSRKVRKMLADAPETDLAVIGEKCKAQLGRNNARNMVLSFSGAGKDVPTFSDSLTIADQISLLPVQYDSIKIVYNKFINASSYEATDVEAYSEEAITQSGMPCPATAPNTATANVPQPTSRLSRSRTRFSPTSASTLLPTRSSGCVPRPVSAVPR